MDINLLTLSVGNTRLAIGTFVAGELRSVVRVPHGQRNDWESIIKQAWEPIADADAPAIAGASVNPPLLEAIEHVASQATGGQKIEWVGRDLDLPMKLLTQHPEQTGVDRILNLAAAFEQMKKGCVVVDAGSAVTVDCCNDAGEFLGGSISPGVAMQLDALHERTAKLPRVAFARPAGIFGDSTEQAILQGVYHGIRGLVKELAESYATALGYWPDVIATGGDAAALFEGWELIHAVSPDLSLYGIALAFVEHHTKHSL